jgi:hypothetical protein
MSIRMVFPLEFDRDILEEPLEEMRVIHHKPSE